MNKLTIFSTIFFVNSCFNPTGSVGVGTDSDSSTPEAQKTESKEEKSEIKKEVDQQKQESKTTDIEKKLEITDDKKTAKN